MTSRKLIYWPTWLTTSVLSELLLFFGSALLLDQLFFSGDRFFHVSPHPFWIPVLLLSVYYGTGPGLLAAAISSLLLLVGNLPEMGPEQNLYEYVSTITLRPMLWGATAVIIGELSARRIRQREKATREYHSLLEHCQISQQELDLSKRQNEELELRLAADSKTLRRVLQRLETIQQADVQDVLDNVAPLIRDLHHARQCSIYFVQHGALEAVMLSGWEDRKSDLIARHEPSSRIYQAVISEGRSLCIANPGDGATLGKQAVMAQPLRDKQSGTVFGMVTVGGMHFTDLNQDTEVLFSIIAEVVSNALLRAARIDMMQTDATDSSHSKAPKDDGRESMLWLIKLGDRMGFQSSFVIIRLQDENLSADVVAAFQSVVASAVHDQLRETDLVLNVQDDHLLSIVALPAAEIEQGLRVAKKLKSTMGDLMPDSLQHLAYRITVSRGRH